jgi:LmbE family N-acetylglucosaminyl deacetylase
MALLAGIPHCQPDVRTSDIEAREAAARRAAKIPGVDAPSFFRFPDNRCDQVATLDLAKAIETLINDLQPDTL